MTIVANDKIKFNRIDINQNIPTEYDAFLVSKNNELKYLSLNEMQSYTKSSNVINGLNISNISNSLLTIESGNVASPIVNENQYVLKLNKTVIDVKKKIGDGNGSADKIRKKVFNQPKLTANNSSPYFKVSSSGDFDSGHTAFKAFNKTNATEADSWCSDNNGNYPKWLKMELKNPISIERFAIQNRNHNDIRMATLFKIQGCTLDDEWVDLVESDNSNKNKNSNAWNDYESKDKISLFKAIKYIVYKVADMNAFTSVGSFEIIGNYQDYALPEEIYNIFVIGKENHNKNEAKILTSTEETPYLPMDYSYSIKIGNFYLNKDYNIIFANPLKTIDDEFKHGNVVAESLGTIGYRIYSDGWKIQWGNNANPSFPVSFNQIPLIVSKRATNVTRTNMTITAGYWNAEGY